MFYFLLLFLVSLLVLVIILILKINNERKKFQVTLSVLQNFITQLTHEQKKQDNRLVLSEELNKKLGIINQSLNKDIFELNFELFEQNYPKKSN
jgi:hypothetical protein